MSVCRMVVLIDRTCRLARVSVSRPQTADSPTVSLTLGDRRDGPKRPTEVLYIWQNRRLTVGRNPLLTSRVKYRRVTLNPRFGAWVEAINPMVESPAV